MTDEATARLAAYAVRATPGVQLQADAPLSDIAAALDAGLNTMVQQLVSGPPRVYDESRPVFWGDEPEQPTETQRLPEPGCLVDGLWWHHDASIELTSGAPTPAGDIIRRFRANPRIPGPLPEGMGIPGPAAGERWGLLSVYCSACSETLCCYDFAGREGDPTWRLVEQPNEWLINGKPAPLVYGSRRKAESGRVDTREIVAVSYDWKALAEAARAGEARGKYLVTCPTCSTRVDATPETFAPIVEAMANSGRGAWSLQQLRAVLSRRPRRR